jgi:DNA-binding transcriptional regulator LsrR (DeoR family)
MVRGDRVDSAEYARRVNAAADIAGAGVSAAVVARSLADRYGVSVRQAHRYLEQAMAAGRLEVPESSVVFTVKLPGSLAGQVRARARESDRAISAVVAQALAEFLERGAAEGRPGG